jgi:hypothetical protein
VTPRRIVWTLILLALLAIRLPSLVEPAGADQSLYAYVGQRINTGGVPYRDAWDQKPPAIHFIYAALWRVWPHESVVAAADLVAAGFAAALLIVLGRRTFGADSGAAAAAIFLLLGNPAIQRLSGVRVRAQCETFIAVAIAAAHVLAAGRHRRRSSLVLAGLFAGLAFWLKYNAGVFLLPVLAMALTQDVTPAPSGLQPGDRRPEGLRLRADASRAKFAAETVGWMSLGFAVISVIFLGYFANHGALTDLRLATIDYNLQYSGETYRGIAAVIAYLTFPLRRARLDLLWYLGGLGVILLLVTSRRRPAAWVAAAWVLAACLSIAINGARNLPQYFVQANPALAFAAGAGIWTALRYRGRIARGMIIAAIAVGLWRVGDEPQMLRLGGLPEVARNAAFDLSYARGQISRTAYLTRFQQQADTKYVPLSAEALTAHVERSTASSDRILVFGLAASVYVNSGRESASRFFWSRPVVVEFARGRRGYGSAGLLDDLRRSTPVLVALQKHWDDPAPEEFFLHTPALRQWLDAGYVLENESSEFSIWRRRN